MLVFVKQRYTQGMQLNLGLQVNCQLYLVNISEINVFFIFQDSYLIHICTFSGLLVYSYLSIL